MSSQKQSDSLNPRRPSGWISTFNKDVEDDIVIEMQLIVLALAAGINDATTFPDYRVFVSNQTGNTALLAVGALGIGGESVDLANIGFSLGFFIASGFLFGRLGDRIGRRRKAWLVLTNFAQTAIMFAGVALRKWLPSSQHKGPHAWAVIILLASSSGGQVAMARTVNMPEVPTAMVTSAYIDFLTDPDILSRHNRPRNRRLLFVISLVVGSFIGASAFKYVEPALALFLAAVLKLTVSFSFLFSRVVHPSETHDGSDLATARENDPA